MFAIVVLGPLSRTDEVSNEFLPFRLFTLKSDREVVELVYNADASEAEEEKGELLFPASVRSSE